MTAGCVTSKRERDRQKARQPRREAKESFGCVKERDQERGNARVEEGENSLQDEGSGY